MTQPQTVRFPTYLEAEQVEQWASGVEDASHVTFVIDQWRQSRLLADARLFALAGLIRRSGRSFSVRYGAGRLTDRPTGDAKVVTELLRNSLGGIALVELAERVVDAGGEDVRATFVQVQADDARARNGITGTEQERVLAVVELGRQQTRPWHHALDGGDRSIIQLTSALGEESRTLFDKNPPMATRYISAFGQFAFEGMENTRIHARTDLDGVPVAGIRFVQLRRLELGRHPAADLAEAAGLLGPYLETMAATFGVTTKHPHLAELTVGDLGPGIPGRFLETNAIYEGAFEDEVQALRDALKSGGTSRRGWTLDAGEGLDKMMRVADELRGFVSIRTGRIHLRVDLANASRDDLLVRQRPYLPGTSVSVLFPWEDRSQQQLSLSGLAPA